MFHEFEGIDVLQNIQIKGKHGLKIIYIILVLESVLFQSVI